MFTHTRSCGGLVRGIVATGTAVVAFGLLPAAPAGAAPTVTKPPPSTTNIGTGIGHAVIAPAEVSAAHHDSSVQAVHLKPAADGRFVDCSQIECYALCWDGHENGHTFCVDTGTHNARLSVTTDFVPWAIIEFINPYVTTNGNTWYELEDLNTGLCLNWGGANDPTKNFIYADYCHPEDYNELFYNHVQGQLVNLAGNVDLGQSSYLNVGECESPPPPTLGFQCLLEVDADTPTPMGTTGWTEYRWPFND